MESNPGVDNVGWTMLARGVRPMFMKRSVFCGVKYNCCVSPTELVGVIFSAEAIAAAASSRSNWMRSIKGDEWFDENSVIERGVALEGAGLQAGVVVAWEDFRTGGDPFWPIEAAA